MLFAVIAQTLCSAKPGIKKRGEAIKQESDRLQSFSLCHYRAKGKRMAGQHNRVYLKVMLLEMKPIGGLIGSLRLLPAVNGFLYHHITHETLRKTSVHLII